jgi:hypothetical protein
MLIMNKTKKKTKTITRIVPNWTLWPTPTLVRESKTTQESYYKEYMSYVNDFNSAVGEDQTELAEETASVKGE